MKKRFRIVLADDHPAIRESIAAAIQDNHADRLEVVAQAGDGVSALEEVRRHKPDLVVLDIGLPRMDGTQVLREIKRFNLETLVLVFSMYEDQAHVVEAIRCGADDYLFKQEARPGDVALHILRALEKDRLHERLFSALRRMDPDRLDLGLAELTPAELDVLKWAAHRGYSMKEIARAHGGVSELTVRKHFERIYAKLGARNQAHAVSLAVKYGLIDPDLAEPKSD
jgi:two-component system, NarL family, response regulator